MPSSLSALSHKPYRQFAAGSLVAGAAIWMLRIAQTLMLLDAAHGSAAAVGLLAATQFAPTVILGTPLGVLADRHSKPLLLCAGHALMASVGVLLAFVELAARWAVPAVFVLALLFGVGAAIDNTLRLTLPPELVPRADIVSAVGVAAICLQVGRLVGPAAGGLLIAGVGYRCVFLVGAAGSVLFMAVLLRLARRHQAVTPPNDRQGGVREGIRYARRQRVVLLVFVMVGVGGLLGPNLATLSTLMVHNVYRGGAAQLGVVTSLLAVGTLLGAVLTARRRTVCLRDVVLATGAVGVTSMAAAGAPTMAVYGVLLVPAGMAALAMVTLASAVVQLAVEPGFRGRVTALYAIVLVIGVPLGSPLLGWLASRTGVRLSITIAGVVVVAVAGAAGLMARRRGLTTAHAS